MHKFGELICKHRKIILIIALVLIIPSIIGMKATRINYDILVYLPDDVETIKGENILSGPVALKINGKALSADALK